MGLSVGIFYPNEFVPKDVAYVHRNLSLVWRHFTPVYRPGGPGGVSGKSTSAGQPRDRRDGRGLSYVRGLIGLAL